LARNVRFKVEIVIIDPATLQNNTSGTPSGTGLNQSNNNSILTNNINVLNNTMTPTTPTTTTTNKASVSSTSSNSYKIVFTLINGSTKQFHQLCKHICNLISMNYSQVHSQHHRQQQQQQLQLQQQQRLQKQQVNDFSFFFYSKNNPSPTHDLI